MLKQKTNISFLRRQIDFLGRIEQHTPIQLNMPLIWCYNACNTFKRHAFPRTRTSKPLLPIGEKPVVLHLIDTLFCSGVTDIVLVTGHRHKELEAVCKGIPHLTIVFNSEYAVTQMFTSACLGFAAVPKHCEQILFLPIDVPMVSISTVRQLIQDTRPLLFPSYQYHRGHPAAIDRRLLPEILQYSGENGLRGAFASLSVRPSYLAVDDPFCLLDMDTPEDYRLILKYAHRGDTMK